MRKILTITAMIAGLGAIAVAAPTDAQARFGGAAMADAVADVSHATPAQYYYYGSRYGSYRDAYAYAPAYGGWGYQWRGNPSSREALDTCAYC